MKSLLNFSMWFLLRQTFLMQDFGHDAFRTKDGDQIFLAEIIRIHQRAKHSMEKHQEWNDALFVCFD